MPGMDTAISGINNLVLRSKIRNDDGIDQLHHFVTVALLAAFAAVTGFVEYAGQPINCWNYGDYVLKQYQDHVNQYCWTTSLYHYPNRSDRNNLPFLLKSDGGPANPDVEMRGDEYGKITFYRWVTVIFLIQAFLFKFPNLMWGEYNAYSGSNIVKMVEMLQDVVFTKEEDKKEKLRQVALFLEQWLRIQRKPHWFLRPDISPLLKKSLSWCTLCLGDNSSNHLSGIYLLTKFTFLMNNIFQFLLISLFLQINFWHFGTKTLQNLLQDTPVPSTAKTFPIISLCHFQTFDDKAGVQPSSKGKWVQCILTINMFLEKLFLLEWFWLLVLFVLTFINFTHWCFKILRTTTAIRFVQRYMKLMGYYNEPISVPKSCSEKQFVVNYLGNDGVFVLRILAVNTNEVIVAQLVEELWKRYLAFAKNPVPMMEAGEEAAETSFIENPKLGVNIIGPSPPAAEPHML